MSFENSQAESSNITMDFDNFEPLNFTIYQNSDEETIIDNSWKGNAKIDFGIEFVSTNTTPPKSVYWARNSAINLLAGLGINFTTNVFASRIDNWLHTYDICSAIGEAKEVATQNFIYYAQIYHIEKEAFSTPTSILLAKLTKTDVLKFSKKVNKASENLIQILNTIIDTNFGARLEYRIEAIPNIKQYFGNSAEDNPNNVRTLEIYKTIRQSNTVWLLSTIFNLDNFIENTQHNQQDQQISDSNEIRIDPAIKELIKNLVTTIISAKNYDNEMNQLFDLI
ncbi:2643_t:CDS:2 [Gigaspora margarita]|uniref:2643_t:CDS:1 n=1 Tax=Gigaspora margarita TaxID=4874 RepID=A0ABN7V2A8_GIGMA|nr:2643_t:CDS:2 [Gigaspora margarita]